MGDGIESFSPLVREWFGATFGAPTPPQERGWPAIQRGEHTLVLAPTGSGKTLAAFLWGIDRLGRELAGEAGPGVRILYLSPLKALNNDIHRNLRVPLQGIRRRAADAGVPFPEIRTAVRSGDTPARERRSLVNRPPHILITTPESLYLLLTGPRARQIFSTLHTVIVDEIHTMAGSKRGVHLALSLERLARLAPAPPQRIGLSATIRPLDEVARFLGGFEGDEADRRPRPVTIVDAAYDKPLDLQVETVLEEGMQVPGGSVWPLIIPRVADLIREHRTTLVFTNNRRLAERTADRLSEELAATGGPPGAALIEDGVAKGVGTAAVGRGTHLEPVRAHHGSMSKEVRLGLERELKAGRLRALVGTSSLELGIDIGSVDLVVQLQAPTGVAQGLQRVGRSGHLVGETSKGRIFPSHREDLVGAAAVAGGMLAGEVEAIRTPRNALDVLAQHVVAMVSVEDWQAEDLLRLVRRAYPYTDLTERAFRSVLDMLAGRYPSETHGSLRPRLSWDRVNDRLLALPGSRMLALTNGGTIPDTGTYGAYLPDRKTRIGDLDEEFVFETRVGDTFMLGSQVWRVLDISEDRVIVGEAPGAFARMPFWHGDQPWRAYELGRRVGALRRRVGEGLRHIADECGFEDLRDVRDRWQEPAVGGLIDALAADFALDIVSVRRLVSYLAGQEERSALATDRRVVVEFFDDALGDPRMVVHSTFGGRVNGPWGIVLADALRERTGVDVEIQANDDGILLRFPEAEGDFPRDLVASLGPEEARSRLLRDLPNTPVFGARFRQNAARALLLPGLRGGRRTPFWLQRLRAKDLLQAVSAYPEFPLLAETYRDCLEDVMDLPSLLEVLGQVRDGAIEVSLVESVTPSPVAQGLLWVFTNLYLYEWDAPRGSGGGGGGAAPVSAELLGDVLRGVDLGDVLRPEAVAEVSGRLQHTRPEARARTAEELFLVLEELGDLTGEELAERAAGNASEWIAQLADQGRVEQVPVGGDDLWVPTELADRYRALAVPRPASAGGEPPAAGLEPPGAEATGGAPPEETAAATRDILERYVAARAPASPACAAARYGLPLASVEAAFDRMVEEGRGLRGPFPGADATALAPRAAVERMHRLTIQRLRREVRPVPFTAWAAHLERAQHLLAGTALSGEGGLRRVLQQLRGFPLTAAVWQRDTLPARLADFQAADLEVLARNGELVWVARGAGEGSRVRLRLFFRGEAAPFVEPAEATAGLSAAAIRVRDLLGAEGALFLVEVATALGLEPGEAEAALAELARLGLATNDSLAAMERALGLAGRGRSGASAFESSLVEQLRSRRGRGDGPRVARSGRGAGLSGHGRPSRSAYRSASRRVRDRLDLDPAREAFLRDGRWALVHRLGVLGPEVPPGEAARRQARQLLLRWGVVSRWVFEREEGAWDWAAVRGVLDRMELRGEVRRGYFVRGLPGLQYALADTLQGLREAADGAEAAAGATGLVVLNATDPAQLYGATAPEGAEVTDTEGRPLDFSRLPSTWVVQHRGLPVLVAEDRGSRLTVASGQPALVGPALVAFAAHLLRTESRVEVQVWNGRPVLETPGRELLEAAGFYRDRLRMSRERAV